MDELKFSDASENQLSTVHPDLVRVCRAALLFGVMDFTVLEGHRGEEAQTKAFFEGLSEKRWPEGKHNKLPSNAVDLAPYPIDLKDTERYCVLAGLMFAAASLEDVKIRWGRDWDKDFLLREEKFRDFGHFELT